VLLTISLGHLSGRKQTHPEGTSGMARTELLPGMVARWSPPRELCRPPTLSVGWRRVHDGVARKD